MPRQKTPIKRQNKNAAYNDAFYHYKWNSVPDGERRCAECDLKIPDEYNAGYISHYLTKNQIPKLPLTPEVLDFSQFHCRIDHTRWDQQGGESGRPTMKSYSEEKHRELQYLFYVLTGRKPARAA